jgi:hypothetical protein
MSLKSRRMKRLFSLTLLFLVLSGFYPGTGDIYFFAYFKGNGEDGLHLAYSRDGYNFLALNNDKSFLVPVVGVSKLMRDPCIISAEDGTFHMLWTAGWTERGIGYASSKDLINWSAQKYLKVMEKEPTAVNCWAPELFYDKKKKQYLIYWSTTIPGRFPETEDFKASKYNHRIYCTITKDFNSFSETSLFYDNGFNVIDATIVKDKKKYIMFVKDETNTPPQKNIRITTSVDLYGPYSITSAPITGQYWAEGPTAIKINNSWIVYFDKYVDKKYGAVLSKDLKNWIDISDKIKFPEGSRHGTIFLGNEQILSRLLKL